MSLNRLSCADVDFNDVPTVHSHINTHVVVIARRRNRAFGYIEAVYAYYYMVTVTLRCDKGGDAYGFGDYAAIGAGHVESEIWRCV